MSHPVSAEEFLEIGSVHRDNALTCPHCGAPTNVLDSRPVMNHGVTTTRRRRACVTCDHRHNTLEVTREHFDRLYYAALRFSRFRSGLEEFIGESDKLLNQLTRAED